MTKCINGVMQTVLMVLQTLILLFYFIVKWLSGYEGVQHAYLSLAGLGDVFEHTSKLFVFCPCTTRMPNCLTVILIQL